MFLVTILIINSPVRQENKFDTLAEANEFLTDKRFVFEDLKNGVHYWIFDRITYGTIEKIAPKPTQKRE